MKNNLFANSLLVLIGILLLLSALQMFGWGRGTNQLSADEFDVSTLSQLDVDETTVATIDDRAIVQITDAPLFSAGRTPYVPIELELESEEDVAEVEAEPLKAKVTSIIITDESSYAMMFDEMSRERVTLKQGMPLPGEQGLWVLNDIQPRMVTFVAEGEEPVELELEVFSGQLKAGAKNNRQNRNRNKNNNKKNNNQAGSDDRQAQKNSAEEIRKKIAERRAQMRANASKGNKE